MKKHLFLTLVFGMIFAGSSVLAFGQKVKVDSQQTRLLLAASSTTTLQQELDQAGALGFHAVMGTTRGNAEMVVILQRELSSKDKIQFKLIATNATGTFVKEITAAAAQGYRAVGPTFLNKPGGPFVNEIVVLMERQVSPAKHYEYKLISTNQTSTFESEWGVATTLGYKALAVLTRTETMMLLEREAAPAK
jgi:hypothetical protein